MKDFLPLELGSTDVVLGMQWLGSLGCMEINWKLLTMKLRMGETWMTMRGDRGLSKVWGVLEGYDEGLVE